MCEDNKEYPFKTLKDNLDFLENSIKKAIENSNEMSTIALKNIKDKLKSNIDISNTELSDAIKSLSTLNDSLSELSKTSIELYKKTSSIYKDQNTTNQSNKDKQILNENKPSNTTNTYDIIFDLKEL